MNQINLWHVALNLVCIIPPKFSNGGYCKKYNPAEHGEIEEKEYGSDYTGINKHIRDLLLAGVDNDIYSHLTEYDLPKGVKRDHVCNMRKKLKIRKISVADKIMELINAGEQIDIISEKTGACKDYIKQVIKRRKR